MMKARTLSAAVALLVAATPLAAQEYDPYALPDLFAPLPGAQIQRAPSLYRPLRPLYQPVVPVAPTPAPGVRLPDPYAPSTLFDPVPRATVHDVYPPAGDPSPYVPEPHAVVPVITDSAKAWEQRMRQMRLDWALEDERFHRLRERHRQAAQDADLNALRRCAQYNRGCFNELGGRLPRQR